MPNEELESEFTILHKVIPSSPVTTKVVAVTEDRLERVLAEERTFWRSGASLSATWASIASLFITIVTTSSYKEVLGIPKETVHAMVLLLFLILLVVGVYSLVRWGLALHERSKRSLIQRLTKDVFAEED